MKLRLPRPAQPNYDVASAQKQSQSERIRLATTNWAQNGYGTPPAALLFYVVKMLLFVGIWWVVLQFNDTSPTFDDSPSWFTQLCLYKTLIWAMTFEILGLGCGSGPLTGRYWPPVGGFRYFLRRGTLRLPILGGEKLYRRSAVDVALYAGFLGVSMWTLSTPSLNSINTVLLVVLLVVMGVRDKTLFLAARGEHYAIMLICLTSTDGWFIGIVSVQLALWFWAAVSKFTVHFPFVITVMTSNAPWQWLSKLRPGLYRSFPRDLRPSKMARYLSTFGTSLELIFPLFLVLGDGGMLTLIGLGLMTAFHVFIILHFPMGVPLEWNLVMIYGGFFCFGALTTFPLTVPPAALVILLFTVVVVIPLLGNLFPDKISFLPSMRYYAGNWAYSIWLFKDQGSTQIQAAFNPPSQSPKVQLERLYDAEVAQAALESVIAFRSMHLHGRVLHTAMKYAVDALHQYEWLDGEIVAGWLLGWNFGDGHLHDHRLLHAVQQECRFETGQLRCIFVDPQPIHKAVLRWRVYDALDGLIAQGECSSHELLCQQPFQAP